jgi:hypothetical protein
LHTDSALVIRPRNTLPEFTHASCLALPLFRGKNSPRRRYFASGSLLFPREFNALLLPGCASIAIGATFMHSHDAPPLEFGAFKQNPRVLVTASGGMRMSPPWRIRFLKGVGGVVRRRVILVDRYAMRKSVFLVRNLREFDSRGSMDGPDKSDHVVLDARTGKIP